MVGLRCALAILPALAVLSAPVAGGAAILQGADDPACQAAVAYSAEHAGASVLVLRQGKAVCEAYTGRGAPDRPMELASGTKSFVGLMAAAAVQDGLLDLDEPVSKTLTEWRDDPVKAKVTLRQVLSLTLGMPSVVGRPPEYAAAVGLPLNADPGARFQYGPAPFQLFGEIMTRKLRAAGQSDDPLAYLHRRILDPIGLRAVGWRRSPAGDPFLPQGAQLTAREWATFGEFVRRGARIDGRQIVDPQAFTQLFQGSTANPAYGLSWWLPKGPPSPDRVTATFDLAQAPPCGPPDLVAALGAGDQRLFVIPSLNLTIARQAELDMTAAAAGRAGRRTWSDRRFLGLVLDADGACEIADAPHGRPHGFAAMNSSP